MNLQLIYVYYLLLILLVSICKPMLSKVMSHLPTWFYSRKTGVAKNWNDLPRDVLTKIAYDLGMKDLLCFRAVCTDWRAASFPCSAENESPGKPWLLVSQGSNSCYILYNPLEKTTYDINIPEMEGTLCLGSDRGWLLLSRQNQLFFFCPFTKAKLDLPEFPHSNLANHLAAFTHCPTSPKCIVTVAYYCNDCKLELHMIQWGENKWSRYVYKHNNKVSTQLSLAAYCEVYELFMYITIKDAGDGKSQVVNFSPKNLSFRSNKISGVIKSDSKPQHICWVSQTYMDKQALNLLNIRENADIIPTCGPIVVENKKNVYYRGKSTTKTSEESQKVIFIHPRFHQIHASQCWSG